MTLAIDLTDAIFHDEDAARAHFEAKRWPNGAYCPHCGSFNVIRMMGTKHRPGAFNCRDCRKAFSATVGTVFEASKVPLHKWMLASHLMTASKKGVSAHQLHRMIHVTYKTAWFMEHRLREAMTTPAATPLGGEGKIVEADEMYHGTQETPTPIHQERPRRLQARRSRPGRAFRRSPRRCHDREARHVQERPRSSG
jgi:transposase-like protein